MAPILVITRVVAEELERHGLRHVPLQLQQLGRVASIKYIEGDQIVSEVLNLSPNQPAVVICRDAPLVESVEEALAKRPATDIIRLRTTSIATPVPRVEFSQIVGMDRLWLVVDQVLDKYGDGPVSPAPSLPTPSPPGPPTPVQSQKDISEPEATAAQTTKAPWWQVWRRRAQGNIAPAAPESPSTASYPDRPDRKETPPVTPQEGHFVVLSWRTVFVVGASEKEITAAQKLLDRKLRGRGVALQSSSFRNCPNSGPVVVVIGERNIRDAQELPCSSSGTCYIIDENCPAERIAPFITGEKVFSSPRKIPFHIAEAAYHLALGM